MNTIPPIGLNIRVVVSAIALALLVRPISAAEDDADRGWNEDPEKVRRIWNARMPPEAYSAAVAAADACDEPARPWERGISWQAVGPTGSFGRTNGRISGIHIRPHGGSYYVYAGACSGGLWRALASDGTGVWTSLGDNLPNPSVRAFAVNPGNPDDIIAGTGDWFRYGGAGMFRTTNAGLSWSPIPLPVPADAADWFSRIHWSSADPNILVAACAPGGIIRSTNGGATWSVRANVYPTDLIVHPTNFNLQYACVHSSGVWRSTNGGVSWTQVLDPNLPSASNFHRASLAICRDAPNTLALVVETSGTLGGIFRSTDGGATWGNITGSVGGGWGQIFHAQAIAIRPNDPNAIYVGCVGLVRTLNAGGTWQTDSQAGIDIGHADQTQLYFSASTGDSTMWICNDGGIYRHTLGGSTADWNGNSVTGLRCSQLYNLDAVQDFYVGSMQDDGTVRSNDGGATWASIAGADGWDCAITDFPNRVFWYSDGVWSPPPEARVSRAPLTGGPSWTSNPNANSVLAHDRRGARLYSPFNAQLDSSPTTGSPSWTVGDVPLPAGYLWYNAWASPLEAGVLYVSYAPPNGDRISVCRKVAGSWQVVTRTHPFGGQVASACISSDRIGELWLGLQGSTAKVITTRDDGVTWQDLTGPPLDTVDTVQAIVAQPLETEYLFAGTQVGMFVRIAGYWVPLQTGLPRVSCSELKYNRLPSSASTQDRLMLATFGRGIYVFPIQFPPVDYVDQSLGDAFENGSFRHPWSSLAEGYTAVPDGGILALRGGIYEDAFIRIDRPVTLRAFAGSVTIR